MKDILIGVDAGTSVIKSVAFSPNGRQIAESSTPNRYRLVPGGGAEQDPMGTWADMVATLRDLAEQVPDLGARAVALAVTGQGDGTWLIDADGEPVGPGLLWLDARAAAITEEKRAEPADPERYRLTGTGLAACQQGPQLLWMRQHTPERLKRAATAFHCKDWLYFKLTGIRATCPAEGSMTFGDFRSRSYSDTVIDALGVSDLSHLLPDMLDGTVAQHRLSAGAAEATGLLPGTPVVLGFLDVVCTALGAGLYEREGDFGCSIIGSTGMHMRLLRNAADFTGNAERTGYVQCMPIPSVVAQFQSNMAATLNIDWIIDLARGVLETEGVSRTRRDLWGRMDGWMEASAPGALLYQPFISEAGERGPFLDARARAGFIGLSSEHGFPQLVRAVIEGLAFSARDCFSAMGDLPAEVRVTGGAARSRSLRSILTAALCIPTRTSARLEAGAAGAAMIAAVGLGHYADMAACTDQWVRPLLGDAEAPDPALAATYRSAYPAYVAAHRALRPVWAKMQHGVPE